MNRSTLRICLLSNTHPSSNPRLVKEAEALHAAGYAVDVVGVQWVSALTDSDARLTRGAGWRFFPVNLERAKHPILSRAVAVQSRLARTLPRPAWGWGVAARAYAPCAGPLVREALRHPADMYIAHNLAALPAARRAARAHGAKLGFDAEDFHSGELPDLAENAAAIERVRWLERTFLPACDHLTAASAGIARAYARLCGLPEPTTLLNVFPVREFPETPGPASFRPGPSLYWFSQTIGPDRGLEDAVRALGALRNPAFLCLRGTPVPGYRLRLERLAGDCGAGDRLVFLQPAPPGEMVRLAALHDVGLALEQNVSPNRRICVTNKLFTYLGAGVPFAATATEGQREVCRALGEVAVLYEPGNWRDLAAVLDGLLSDRESLDRRRRSAWRLARDRYNWDREKETFLDLVDAAMAVAKPARGKDREPAH